MARPSWRNPSCGLEWDYWPRFIANALSWYAGKRRWVALVRAMWRTVVLHDNGELCQECGRDYPLWHATAKTWRAVQGEKTGGLFCIACFDRKAEAVGMPVLWIARSWREDDPIPAEMEWDR